MNPLFDLWPLNNTVETWTFSCICAMERLLSSLGMCLRGSLHPGFFHSISLRNSSSSLSSSSCSFNTASSKHPNLSHSCTCVYYLRVLVFLSWIGGKDSMVAQSPSKKPCSQRWCTTRFSRSLLLSWLWLSCVWSIYGPRTWLYLLVQDCAISQSIRLYWRNWRFHRQWLWAWLMDLKNVFFMILLFQVQLSRHMTLFILLGLVFWRVRYFYILVSCFNNSV